MQPLPPTFPPIGGENADECAAAASAVVAKIGDEASVAPPPPPPPPRVGDGEGEVLLPLLLAVPSDEAF